MARCFDDEIETARRADRDAERGTCPNPHLASSRRLIRYREQQRELAGVLQPLVPVKPPTKGGAA